MTKSPHMWMDQYPVTDPKHIHDLETTAAIHQFISKHPRHKAEALAHDEYRRGQIAQAAAHHLSGMKSAHAAGAMDEAKKHGVMYSMALKELGHDPKGEVPPEVSNHLKNLETSSPVYKFKAHKGDAFTVPKEEPKDLAKSTPPPPPTPKASLPLAGRQLAGSNHFNYSDHLPEHSKAGGFKQLTVSQTGNLFHANLGQHGTMVAHKSPSGEFSVIHDTLSSHPKASVRMQAQHAMNALKNHISQVSQSPHVATKLL
jgi:hypothetical protein